MSHAAEKIYPQSSLTEPADILVRGLEEAGGLVSLACSFSVEDVVIIDLAQRMGLHLGVFAIDKVEPLGRALKGLAGWVTGLRREQSITRTNLTPLGTDLSHGGILKVNPLIYWTEDEVWEYAKRERIPVNRLHRMGYPSIGCAPCTRAVRPGESSRAGRWWWEDPEHKECGLHRR
jgi:3'-phosphoadenosine 5'-phosphosulfate sulfotransferase (PAPS reductase)/FAD synthetase